MKALIYTGAETLEHGEAPAPELRDGEALIRIEHVGICGSDMHAYLGHDERRPAPLILGHEAAGRIIEGPGAGKRVTINPLVTCGVCEACLSGRENICPHRQIISMPPREGAFAELLAMPPRNLVEIPDGVPTEKAALAEPIACGWHAVRLARQVLGRPLAEARCLAIGGGAIGLGAALALRAQGAGIGAGEITLAEPHAARRSLIAESEGFRVVDPSGGASPSDLGVADVDLVIDGVGYEATRAFASAAVKPGGVIIHIGLGSGAGGLDIRRMTLQEIAFFGAYTYSAQDFRDTAAAIFDGRLGALDWPEIRPLASGAGAFADIKAGRVAAPKIILQP
ncbi:MAG: alcohol dehydrogenase catalytic domain-containing protein [Pseudomonadota bacterium]